MSQQAKELVHAVRRLNREIIEGVEENDASKISSWRKAMVKLSKARNELSEEDSRKVDKHVNIDLFVYVFAVAVKKRDEDLDEDEDDIDFMARLHERLIEYQQRKANAEAAAGIAFDFEKDGDAGPSSKGRTQNKGNTKKTVTIAAKRRQNSSPEFIEDTPTPPPQAEGQKKAAKKAKSTAAPAPVPARGPAPVPGSGPARDEISSGGEEVVRDRVPKRIKYKSAAIVESSQEEAEDFSTFVRSFDNKRKSTKGKAKERKPSEASASGSEFEDNNHSQHDEEEDEQMVDDEEQGNWEDEEDIKPGFQQKNRSQAKKRRGKPNTYPCDACVKKGQTCYSQISVKARGACFECGRLKSKCIYSVLKEGKGKGKRSTSAKPPSSRPGPSKSAKVIPPPDVQEQDSEANTLILLQPLVNLIQSVESKCARLEVMTKHRYERILENFDDVFEKLDAKFDEVFDKVDAIALDVGRVVEKQEALTRTNIEYGTALRGFWHSQVEIKKAVAEIRTKIVKDSENDVESEGEQGSSKAVVEVTGKGCERIGPPAKKGGQAKRGGGKKAVGTKAGSGRKTGPVPRVAPMGKAAQRESTEPAPSMAKVVDPVMGSTTAMDTQEDVAGTLASLLGPVPEHGSSQQAGPSESVTLAPGPVATTPGPEPTMGPVSTETGPSPNVTVTTPTPVNSQDGGQATIAIVQTPPVSASATSPPPPIIAPPIAFKDGIPNKSPFLDSSSSSGNRLLPGDANAVEKRRSPRIRENSRAPSPNVDNHAKRPSDSDEGGNPKRQKLMPS